MSTASARPLDQPPDDADGEVDAAAPRPNSRRWSQSFAAAVRWLHIYLSLLGFSAILFFSLTGVTLNHPDWFGLDAPRHAERAGTLPATWLGTDVDKLAIAERLRATHHLRGAVADFRIDDRELSLTFKGPAYAADVLVDRATGQYDLTVTEHGVVALINDLHKGRDSGRAWSALIDVAALLMAVSALTGLVLIFYIRRRRFSGLATMVVGTLLLAALYCWFVP